MQPNDFIALKPLWVCSCQLCGRPFTLNGWSIPRVCCIKIGATPRHNGVMITPNTIRSIIIEHTDAHEKLTLVDFYEDVLTYNILAHMYNKTASADATCVAARAYWRRWCHREYKRAIAQWLQRELLMPGEIAQLISEFT